MDVRIPNLGEGAESGTVVTIFVKEGDAIQKDQTLIELENEKAVAPIPSSHAGTVTKILVKVGDKVSVGQPIVSLGEGGTVPAPKTTPTAAKAPVVHAPVSAPAPVSSGAYQYESKSGFAPPASPSVRKLAAEVGIDLSRVRGSEAGGRITAQDLRAYIQYLQTLAQGGAAAAPAPAAAPKPPAESVDFSKWGPVEKKPLTSLRQKISQKMSESWTTIPHVTQFEEADITALMALRKKYAPAYEKKGAKLTLTSLVIKAVVPALQKLPGFNASLDEAASEYVFKKYIHIGVAVDTEAGLIVPVIRDADKKSILEIAKDLETLAKKTRERKISAEELRGGSFTISNLGGIGGTFFTPIVNKPEVAILGVGRGVTRPVFADGSKTQVEPRVFLPLGLSYDHRVVDGADGARFIREIAHTLENFDEKEIKL